MSAAAASRDITLFHAMDLLHASGYDFARGALALVDHGAPRLASLIVYSLNYLCFGSSSGLDLV
jgi:hypothetical protein